MIATPAPSQPVKLYTAEAALVLARALLWRELMQGPCRPQALKAYQALAGFILDRFPDEDRTAATLEAQTEDERRLSVAGPAL